MIHTERTQIINGLKVRITPASVGDMLMIIYVQWCLHEGAQVQKKGLKNVCHKLSWELPNSTCFSQALILRWEFFPYHRLDLYLNHHASACCVIFLGRCNRHIYHTHSHHAHTYHTYLPIHPRKGTHNRSMYTTWWTNEIFFFLSQCVFIEVFKEYEWGVTYEKEISQNQPYI